MDAKLPENRETRRAGPDEVDGEMPCAGRIANVSAALLASPGAEGSGARQLLSRFFDELVRCDFYFSPEAPSRLCLERILELFEAASGERVLLCVSTDSESHPAVLADLVLGLVCWPEADAVIVSDASRAGLRLCGIFRREVATLQAREIFGHDSRSVSDWIDRLAPERIELAQMGFEPDPFRPSAEMR